ncbi:MAG: hypothetical protein GY810_32395 [Aureispira sp.]|nr:hypothetical protein [Aureispira sp.]
MLNGTKDLRVLRDIVEAKQLAIQKTVHEAAIASYEHKAMLIDTSWQVHALKSEINEIKRRLD